MESPVLRGVSQHRKPLAEAGGPSDDLAIVFVALRPRLGSSRQSRLSIREFSPPVVAGQVFKASRSDVGMRVLEIQKRRALTLWVVLNEKLPCGGMDELESRRRRVQGEDGHEVPAQLADTALSASGGQSIVNPIRCLLGSADAGQDRACLICTASVKACL